MYNSRLIRPRAGRRGALSAIADDLLPAPPKPLGTYATWFQHDRWLFLSGMLPVRDGAPAYRGRLGAGLSLADGRAAAALAARNGLAVARSAVGDLARIAAVARLTVFLATNARFTEHAQVADAASDELNRWLIRRRPHARLAIGVASLPRGMPVELEMILAIHPARGAGP